MTRPATSAEEMSQGRALALAGEALELAVLDLSGRPRHMWPAWALDYAAARVKLAELYRAASPCTWPAEPLTYQRPKPRRRETVTQG